MIVWSRCHRNSVLLRHVQNSLRGRESMFHLSHVFVVEIVKSLLCSVLSSKKQSSSYYYLIVCDTARRCRVSVWFVMDNKTPTISLRIIVETGIAAAATSNLASSPYSLYASNNHGALISLVVLKGDNYAEWATEMFNALRPMIKTSFIDGSLKKRRLEAMILKLGFPSILWLWAGSVLQ